MTTKTEDTEAVKAPAAAALRRIALEIAGSDDAMRNRALMIAYEGFIRGMTHDSYTYSWEAKAAARAILGLPEPAED